MAGLPGIDDIDSYGGVFINYSPIEDPQTDLDAGFFNLISSNVAGMTQTAWRAIVRVQMNGAAAPTLLQHWAVWGNGPSVAPTLVRSGVGALQVIWPSTVVDALVQTKSVAFRDASLQMRGLQAIKLHPIVDFPVSPNQVFCYFFTSADAASDGTTGQQFTLFVS